MIFPIATRAQAITLRNCGYSWENIEKQTGVGKGQLRYIVREAKKRGYNPDVSLTLKDEYFHDGFRSGRPTKLSEEQTESLIAASKPVEGQPKKTNAALAQEFGISQRTVRRFKEIQGEYKKPEYRLQRKDFPATVAQARGEADVDMSMTSTSSTEEPSTLEDALREQLQAASTAQGYEEVNLLSTTQNNTLPSR